MWPNVSSPFLQEVFPPAPLRLPAAHEGVAHRLFQTPPLPHTGQEVDTHRGHCHQSATQLEKEKIVLRTGEWGWVGRYTPIGLLLQF